MEPGLGIKKGLYLVEDKDGIIKILSKTNGDTDVLKFFANHDINAPIYAPNIHTIENQDINALSLKDGVDQPNGMLSNQTSRVGEEINSNTTESEYNEERSETDPNGSEDIQDIANNLDVPKERCNLVHFNVDDQRQYFELGMTFGCADEVREEIAKYAISRGVALKFVRSD